VRERLESWKEIAAYLGREVRTVQRWATDRGLPVHRLPGGVRPRVFSTKPELDAWLQEGSPPKRPEPVSVAVLPFLNLTGRPDDQYFGDGLAEDLINALVRIPGLRVIARTSSFVFAGRGCDVHEIGRRLGAAWLIEGSVRRARKRVRISAQLVNTRDGVHAWSECFDRQVTDLFAIQDDIARAIASALQVTLAVGGPVTRQARDVAAYALWVKGRSISQQFTPAAITQARQCFEDAIRRDPAFARPYFGLADLLFAAVQFGLVEPRDALPQLHAAITRSLELDGSFPEAHALQGVIRGTLDYDWPGAEASFTRALTLGPGSASVLIAHAWFHLVPRRQIAQALDEAERAVALDPLSALVRGRLGLVRMAARQYGAAVEDCRAAVDLAPGRWWAHWFHGTALLLHGRLADGFREARRLYDEVHQPQAVGGMALLYGLFRRRARARRCLAELETMSAVTHVPPMAWAFAYIGLGDDRMFAWLNKAVDDRDPVVTHLPSMPLYDSIRDDPRFQALLVRMNLA
jgi:serine/threonine-protein kinase